ncbi:MAG TPA: TolC family protein [Myxococcaceae bacterium]|nr:TolC family protein [Myxococcaceae bacterium]
MRFSHRFSIHPRAVARSGVRLAISSAAALLLISAVAGAQGERVLTLDEALRITRQRSRDLFAARARQEQADTGVEQAWSSLLPTVSAQGKYTHNYKQVELNTASFNTPVLNLATAISSSTPSPAEAAAVQAFQNNILQNPPPPAVIQQREQLDGLVQATIPLIVPSGYYGLSAARLSSEAAAATYDSTDATVLLQVAQSFYGLAGAQELLTARKNAVGVARETTNVAQNRLETGTANKVELQRAQVALLRAQQAEVEANDVRAQSQRGLATLLDLREPFRVDPEKGPKEISTPAEELARDALRLRAEVIALERNIAAVDAQAKAAGWRWSPTLSGFGNYRVFNYAGFSGDHYSWALGLQLDWLIYDGGARDSQRHLAAAQRRENEARLSLLRDTVTDDIANAQQSVQTKRSALNTALQAVDLSRQTLELVRSQYEVGTATQLDLLTAQDSLVTADVAVAQARFDLALAALSLQRSAGVFPSKDLR